VNVGKFSRILAKLVLVGDLDRLAPDDVWPPAYHTSGHADVIVKTSECNTLTWVFRQIRREFPRLEVKLKDICILTEDDHVCRDDVVTGRVFQCGSYQASYVARIGPLRGKTAHNKPFHY
jgi:hypothetical protein